MYTVYAVLLTLRELRKKYQTRLCSLRNSYIVCVPRNEGWLPQQFPELVEISCISWELLEICGAVFLKCSTRRVSYAKGHRLVVPEIA